MSVRKLKENKITKDGRSWVFIQYSKGLDGKRHQYQSKAYMTENEALQAEKEYLNKYKELYMKHAQGILNEEETIMLLSMQSFMDKHDYSIASIKTELLKYEISKLENFKVEETGISFK